MSSWRSETLPWIALGSVVALMATCSSDHGRQNSYRTRAECERDYSAAECQRQGGGGAHGSYYFGPRYYGDARTADDPGAGRTAFQGRSQVASEVHAARGGFGGTGRGYSGGYG